MTSLPVQEGVSTQGMTAPRLVAANVGVKSPDELDTAKQFWETLFGVSLAD
jgi:hypothetical protein